MHAHARSQSQPRAPSPGLVHGWLRSGLGLGCMRMRMRVKVCEGLGKVALDDLSVEAPQVKSSQVKSSQVKSVKSSQPRGSSPAVAEPSSLAIDSVSAWAIAHCAGCSRCRSSGRCGHDAVNAAHWHGARRRWHDADRWHDSGRCHDAGCWHHAGGGRFHDGGGRVRRRAA